VQRAIRRYLKPLFGVFAGLSMPFDLVEACYLWGVAAVAITAGHDRDRSTPSSSRRSSMTPAIKQVEIDRHPSERSCCHSRPMAGFHGASTRDQLCAGAAASSWAHPEQPRKYAST
jgi:hypothetical protein